MSRKPLLTLSLLLTLDTMPTLRFGFVNCGLLRRIQGSRLSLPILDGSFASPDPSKVEVFDVSADEFDCAQPSGSAGYDKHKVCRSSMERCLDSIYLGQKSKSG